MSEMTTINITKTTLKRFRGYKLNTQAINQTEMTDDDALNALLDKSNNADIRAPNLGGNHKGAQRVRELIQAGKDHEDR